MQRPHTLHDKVIREFVGYPNLVECYHLVHVFVLDFGQHHDVAPAHHHVGLEQDVYVFVISELTLDHVAQFVLLLLVSLPLDLVWVLATQVYHFCYQFFHVQVNREPYDLTELAFLAHCLTPRFCHRNHFNFFIGVFLIFVCFICYFFSIRFTVFV